MHVHPECFSQEAQVEVRTKQVGLRFTLTVIPEASKKEVFGRELRFETEQFLLLALVVGTRARRAGTEVVARIVIDNRPTRQVGAVLHVLFGSQHVRVPEHVDQLAGHALFLPGGLMDEFVAAAAAAAGRCFFVRWRSSCGTGGGMLVLLGDDQGLDALDDEKAAVLIPDEFRKATVVSAETLHHGIQIVVAFSSLPRCS